MTREGSKMMMGGIFSCERGSLELVNIVAKLDLEVFITLLCTVDAKIGVNETNFSLFICKIVTNIINTKRSNYTTTIKNTSI